MPPRLRIFVTGATGFIGRAFGREAGRRGHALLSLSRRPQAPAATEERVARGDLGSIPWPEVEAFGPDAALHLAWTASPGEYLHSPENEVLVGQSRAMLERLLALGVGHVAVAGTCIEYAPCERPLDERASPLRPEFPYSRAKDRLRRELERMEGGGERAAWLRIFYPYGPDEHPGRLTTAFARTLASGRPLELRTPDSVKDFVFIDDVASALCDVLEARLAGPVNIGTGTGTPIRRIAELLADGLDLPRSRIRPQDPPEVDPRPSLVARTDRLRSTGWAPRTALERGLDRLLASLDGIRGSAARGSAR